MRLFAWFLSQWAYYWCIEKLLIFVCWFSILLIFWKYLSELMVFLEVYLGLLNIWSYHLKAGIICILCSSSCLIALAKISSTTLNKRVDFLVFFLMLRKCFQFSPHSVYCLWLCYKQTTLMMLKYESSILSFLQFRVFIMGYWILSKVFLLRWSMTNPN
jgi:hypothetical protein